MSEILNKLGAVARQTADTVSIQVAIASEEQKIRTAYQMLGKLWYRAEKQGKPAGGPEADQLMARIDGSLDRIRELKFRKTVDPCTDGSFGK